MVVIRASKMSRTEEVHRITENVYKSIMERFNPCLRNFIAMGKTYEKTLSSVTFAAKGYFDALMRMGKLASESRSSKDLGDVLLQMAEVHRQIQMQLEDMLKSFHNDLLTELEKKVEMDVRYLNAALRKYQTEHKSKGESLEKCQAELKKLRKKSQGSKKPSRYEDKEMQYVETISSKQAELHSYITESYRKAASEERRRYCFLVARQCAVAKATSVYHTKGRDLLAHKIPAWQQAYADPNKPSAPAVLLAQQMGSGAGGPAVPPELAAFRGSQQMVNGATGVHGRDDYQRWMETRAMYGRPFPQSHRHGAETFSNTLPARRGTSVKPTSTLDTQTLPRSSSMAAALERNGWTRVQALFSHTAGDNSTLLSFTEGDVITLLVPEARDGWHYGENEKNRMRGWFPFSYTRVIPQPDTNTLHVSSQHIRSSSTGNLLERETAIHTSDYSMPAQHSRQRPYSTAMPAYSQHGLEDHQSRFQTSEEGKLISTV